MQRLKKSLLLLLLILPALFFSQENVEKYEGEMDEFLISDKSIVYNNLPRFIGIPDQIRVDNYTIKTIDKLPFVFDSKNEKQFLILKNDKVAVVYWKGGSQVLFYGVIENLYKKEQLVSPWDLTATSYLIEGATEYPPDNMGDQKLDLPWVEGVDGQGIGEKFSFSMGPFTGVYIFNGFVSYDRPDLYLKNSRVKSFIVRDLNTGSEKCFELEDTPNPQLIDIPESKNHKIELEIADVYPGTKYEDTCIAGIALKNF